MIGAASFGAIDAICDLLTSKHECSIIMACVRPLVSMMMFFKWCGVMRKAALWPWERQCPSWCDGA